ncbi:MAG: type II secretion system F family protein [Planctomycetota bacterium]
MNFATVIGGVITGTVGLAVFVAVWLRLRDERLAAERLTDDAVSADDAPAPRRARRLFRRYRWIGPLAGIAAGFAVWAATGLAVVIAVAAGLVTALLTSQFLDFLYQRRLARLEADLADAIDLMVGSLGAGVGATAAIDAAARETRGTLKALLTDLLNRIRLGDAPREVFEDLNDRVPRETFLLFSSTLAIHWEVGGSLAPILASVGRTIRDRIEVGRRIRTNTTQARLSVVAVIALTYFIAFVVGRSNPEQMEAFLFSETAAWFIAGSLLLQALGVFWMSRLATPRF